MQVRELACPRCCSTSILLHASLPSRSENLERRPRQPSTARTYRNIRRTGKPRARALASRNSCPLPHFEFSVLPSPLSPGKHAACRITNDDAIAVAHSHTTDVAPNIDLDKVGRLIHVTATGVYDLQRQIPHVVDILVSRSEEHTSELQSRQYLVCRLLLEKK